MKIHNFLHEALKEKLWTSSSYPLLSAPGVAPAPQKAPRRVLDLEGLAAFEASKRRERHPAALRADVQREQKRVEATSTPYRKAEGAGQLALFDQGKA